MANTTPGTGHPEKRHAMVVLIHGLAAHRFVLRPIERHLATRGLRTVNWGYPSILRPIEAHSQNLRARLREIEQDATVAAVHLVAHSMGAIIARHALSVGSIGKLGRIVMLGPPNSGSRVWKAAGTLHLP